MNVIPTHPDADSYTTLAFADDYLSMKDEEKTWSNLSNTQKERYLVRASRQLDMLPISSLPLYYEAINFRRKQGLKFPLLHDRTYQVPATSLGARTMVSSQLAGLQHMPTGYFDKGALVIIEGTGRGSIYQIATFNGETGTVTVTVDFTAIDLTSRIVLVEQIHEDVQRAVCEQALYLITYQENPLVSKGISSVKVDDVSETYVMPFGSSINGVSYSIEALGYIEPFISTTSRMQT